MDSYRWLTPTLAAYYRSLDLQREDPLPWSRLSKAMKECRIAVVTTAGVHLASDAPFDLDRERREPVWGDPSYRMLPREVDSHDIEVSHLHYDASDAKEDLDVVLPVPLLRQLESEGVVGDVAPRHYSFMGFQLNPSELLDRYLPEVMSQLREDAVDAVVLTPA